MATLNIMVGEAQSNVPVTILRLEGDIDAATQKALQDKATEVVAGGAASAPFMP